MIVNELSDESNSRQDSGVFKPVAAVVLAFLISRWLYYEIGVRFDQTLLFYAWQFLDVDLLQNRLIESTYYLHSQPPLFNLFLGTILKAFSQHSDTAFQMSFLGFGLVMGVSLVILMVNLGVSRFLASVLTVAFIASPTTILYENWLFYTYPVASLLCLAALLFHQWLVKTKLRIGVIFFALAAAIVLTRSLFQLPWVALICIPALLYHRIGLKSVLISLAVPLILVTAWQAKNYYHFGVFGTSTWLGMSLSRNSLGRMAPEDIRQLIEQGKLSETAVLPFFGDYEFYEGPLQSPSETGIPALDEKVKYEPSIGINYNYIGYADVSRALLRDALCAIRSRPYDFANALMNAFKVYLSPASDYPYLQGNRERIYRLDHSPDRFTWRQGESRHAAPFIVIWFGIALVYGAGVLIGWAIKRPADVSAAATILFLWLTIFYVTVLANIFESVETNRIRFLVDPYILVIVGVALSRGLQIVSWTRMKTWLCSRTDFMV